MKEEQHSWLYMARLLYCSYRHDGMNHAEAMDAVREFIEEWKSNERIRKVE